MRAKTRPSLTSSILARARAAAFQAGVLAPYAILVIDRIAHMFGFCIGHG